MSLLAAVGHGHADRVGGCLVALRGGQVLVQHLEEGQAVDATFGGAGPIMHLRCVICSVSDAVIAFLQHGHELRARARETAKTQMVATHTA